MRNIMKYNHTPIISAILLLICTGSFAQAPLSFNQPWIAEAPPVSTVLAAYMEIVNSSDGPIIISSMESDDFRKIEFHKTSYEDDIAKMEHLPSLAIPAAASLTLEPGSYHIMLFGPVKKLLAGDSSTFTVTTSDKQQYQIIVPVKKSDTTHQHHHHH